MRASIEIATNQLIEAQSHADAETLLNNAVALGYARAAVTVREISPVELAALLAIANPPPPRELDADVVITALKQAGKLAATETAASTATKDKDRFYWQRRASFVESNPKLARLALAGGWDVKAVFDLAQTL